MMIEYWLQNWLTFWPDGRSFRILSELGVVFGTDRGPVRNSNQDRVVVIRLNSATPESSFICAIVCDGMGGMKHGDVCASIGIASFVDRVIQLAELGPHESMLKDAIRFANESVHRFAKGSGGTTLSAVLISGNSRAWWANVGDSRVYGLANNRKGEMVRLTVDDTLEEAFGGHGKELVQFVGIGSGIEPHVGRIESRFDSLIITTDGIHSIEPALFARIYGHAPNYKSGAERLLAASNWVSGSDNSTIVGISMVEASESLAHIEPIQAIEIWKPGDNTHVVIPLPRELNFPIEEVKHIPAVTRSC